MKLAVIGFGNAGSKIADRIVEYEAETGRSLCRFTAVVNTASIDLKKISYIPKDHRVLIGQTDERSKGHGAGADPELGRISPGTTNPSSRGSSTTCRCTTSTRSSSSGPRGGTGSGGGPVLAEILRERYEEPVYGPASSRAATRGSGVAERRALRPVVHRGDGRPDGLRQQRLEGGE